MDLSKLVDQESLSIILEDLGKRKFDSLKDACRYLGAVYRILEACRDYQGPCEVDFKEVLGQAGEIWGEFNRVDKKLAFLYLEAIPTIIEGLKCKPKREILYGLEELGYRAGISLPNREKAEQFLQRVASGVSICPQLDIYSALNLDMEIAGQEQRYWH